MTLRIEYYLKFKRRGASLFYNDLQSRNELIVFRSVYYTTTNENLDVFSDLKERLKDEKRCSGAERIYETIDIRMFGTQNQSRGQLNLHFCISYMDFFILQSTTIKFKNIS